MHNENKYKIIHLGPEDLATSSHRISAFKNLNHDVQVQYYSLLNGQNSKKFNKNITIKRIIRFFFRKAGLPLELNNENQKLITNTINFNPDIIFIEKALTIKKTTIKEIKKINNKINIIFFSLDDMLNPDNQSRYYIKAIPYYDLHVTNKDFNVKELYSLGAKNVLHIPNSYNPEIHKPMKLSKNEKKIFKFDVSFVGDFEKDRAEIMYKLANKNIVVNIWGTNWKKFKKYHKNLVIHDYPVYNLDYSRVISASKISLCFLRKVNRDKITTRSIEIPACRGFMLAERSSKHLELFKEDVEAAYFSNSDELLRKIKFYLKNDFKRDKIAFNGHKKCLSVCDTQEISMNKILKLYNLKEVNSIVT